jgi:hypothetical protein
MPAKLASSSVPPHKGAGKEFAEFRVQSAVAKSLRDFAGVNARLKNKR